jgi:general secretion pathway protein D
LSWQGANNVAVGDTVTVELWINSPQALSVVPMAVSYDPRMLSVVSVEQGSFMSNAGTPSSLSKRADAASGVVRAVLTASGEAGKPAEGSLLRLVFKGIAPSDSTRISVSETASGVTPSGEVIALAPPTDWLVRVK